MPLIRVQPGQLRAACEELISVRFSFRFQSLCLAAELAPVHEQLSHCGSEEQGGQTLPSLPHTCDALIHAAPSFTLSPRRSPLCPLTSINVMVHQWWRTLSQGRTPLLIWLLLMGENMINKFNYPWPISNGGDRIIIHVISEVWIWRELITLVSCYGWTGYVNIFHIHDDELLCKGQRGSERYRRWTPPVVSSVVISSSLGRAFTTILMTGAAARCSPQAAAQMMKTDG